jgi:uncharacterized membrane protein YhfC
LDTLIRLLNPLLMILLGLGAGVVMAGRARDPWRLYAAGAWTFLLSQVFHIPFNGWVLEPWLLARFPDGPVPGAGLLVFAAALGLSAGVFEETARWLAFRLAVPRRRWPEALALGAGHGGIEAVLLGVLGLYAVLQLVAVRGPEAPLLLDPGQLADLGQAEAQIAAFWSAPWYAVLLGAVERFFTICFHLSASVLVLQAFRRRSPLWVLAAVLWHALLDAAAVYTAVRWGPYWAEAVIGVFALAALGIIAALREPAEQPAPQPAPDPAALPVPLSELEPRKPGPEEIDASRYN